MKILILRYSAMGDIALLSGPLKLLRQKLPDAEIHLATSAIGLELLADTGTVDHFHLIEKGSSLFQLLGMYRNLPKFDYIFDLQGKFKTQVARLFVSGQFYTMNKDSKARRAFVKNRTTDSRLGLHVVERYFEPFQQAFGWLKPELEELRPNLRAHKLIWNKTNFDIKDAVVLHPYASHKNKVWPHAAHFVDLLQKQNRPVIVVGSSTVPMDFKIEVGKDLTNQTSLGEMLSLMSSAHAVISTDSGPLHLAVAVNKPTLALFGPTTREFGFAPLFKGARILEESELDCRPCHLHGGDTCPLGHHKCMKDLSAERALHILNQF